MRSSAEARCPVPKVVEDPTNTTHPMTDVFFNICSTVQGNPLKIAQVSLGYNIEPYFCSHFPLKLS